MDAEFWNTRWHNNQIGFHQPQVNDFLKQYYALLRLKQGDTVFVPLCGKSLDMLWLAEQGVDVLGVEFSEKAIKDFFEENQIACSKSQSEAFVVYKNEQICLLTGDFFAMGKQQFERVNAVFDRASLIALPKDKRLDYVAHLAKHLAKGCKILLVTMEYPEGAIPGPPFCVPEDEVQQLFSPNFKVEHLTTKENKAMGQRLINAGLGSITEKVWLMTKLG